MIDQESALNIEQLLTVDADESPAHKALVGLMMLGQYYREHQEQVERENRERHEIVINSVKEYLEFVFPGIDDYDADSVFAVLKRFDINDLTKIVRSKTREYFRVGGYSFHGQAQVLINIMSTVLEYGIRLSGYEPRVTAGLPDYYTMVKQLNGADKTWRAFFEALRTYSMDKTPTGSKEIPFANKQNINSAIVAYNCQWQNWAGVRR